MMLIRWSLGMGATDSSLVGNQQPIMLPMTGVGR